MAASKKKYNSSLDSGVSSVDQSGGSEVKALEPLLELLLDLQKEQDQVSVSTKADVVAHSNSSEKQKTNISSPPGSSTSTSDKSVESQGFEVLFKAVHSSPTQPSVNPVEKSEIQQNLEAFSADHSVNFTIPNSQAKSQPSEKEIDLISLQTLLEVPADALDVSYSVAPLEVEKNQEETTLEGTTATVESHPDVGLDFLEQLQGLTVESTASESTASNSDDSLEQLQDLIFGSTRSDFEQLKQQLFESDLPEVRKLMERISTQLQSLEDQIYQPEQLIELIRPWIAEILSQKVSQSKEDVIQALKPIIDEVIIAKSRDNREQMSAAIADLIPEAIKHQIRNSPKEIAQAIGPEIGAAIREQIRIDRDEIVDALAPTMGKTIKEQVSLERDSMVDALYPVIGSTITRYLGEAIREINDKVANALSLEGVQRKIQAKLQGVSEAELILQEVIKSTVQAVFLIHKSSGLIISEVQQSGEARLESEMLAGMLTAIRSFVNDCIVQAEEIKELNEIEYGDSRILIEVAGYCYLAVIIKGEIRKQFIQKIRRTLIKITQTYGTVIETFDGDPDTIPAEIPTELEKLMMMGTQKETKYSNQYPEILLTIAGVTASIIVISLGVVQYRSGVIHRVETEVSQALNSEPELAIYRLGVDAQSNTVILNGKLPNQRLREKAEAIVQQIVPNWTIENDIIAVEVPPDPLLVEAEVQRLTETLNQMNGISISTQYEPDRVRITGTVLQQGDIAKVTEAFEKIQGVNSVVTTVQVQPLPIATRIYFNLNSYEFNSEDMIIKIYPISQYLKQHPNLDVKIVGYTHQSENLKRNPQLALKRSQTVQTALESYGIDRRRMTAVGKNEPPPGVEENHPEWLNRAVTFEIILPEDQGK